MHNHSSIFSFDTCIEFPRLGKVAILTLSILLSVRILFAVCEDKIAKVTQDPEPLVSMLSYLQNSYQSNPKVLFFGSSRFISAIDSKLFASLANLDPQTVINLAVESGGPWEALTIVRQNPSLLASASVAVIEIEPWMFNRNMLNPILNEPWQRSRSFHRWATITDRLQLTSVPEKLRLTSEVIWPLYEKRTINSWILDTYSALHMPNDTLPVAGYQKNAAEAKSLATNIPFSASAIVHAHMHNYEFSSEAAAYLEELITIIQGNSIRVILIQPPVRHKYVTTIRKNLQYSTGYNDFLAFLNDLRTQTAANFILCEITKDCGLDDTIFIDYGHFTLEGSQKFTKKVFRKFLEMDITF